MYYLELTASAGKLKAGNGSFR